MILESAYLQIKAGQAEAFEIAFKQASTLIASIEGYITHSLHKCLEDEHRYLLLVEWQTLEAHTEGFRGSDAYQAWKRLLHHFYEPFPEVYHFEQVSLNDET